MEKTGEKEPSYGELASLLRSDGPLGEPKAVYNTELHSKIKALTDMAYPSLRKHKDTRWFGFYAPLRFRGGEVLIPFSVVEYEGTYFLGFESSDHLKDIRVKEGKKSCSSAYIQLVEGATKRLPAIPALEEAGQLEKFVPYDFRRGKIKGKHVMDGEKVLSREYARKLSERYHIHVGELPLFGSRVSLNEYLRVVSVADRAVFPGLYSATPLEIYQNSADFRHGGMLDIKDPDSVEEFNAWLKSSAWAGSHPFEIVLGAHTTGISLFPPRSVKSDSGADRYFVMHVGSPAHMEKYVSMVAALIGEHVPFVAPDFDESISYLTGRSDIRVNDLSKEPYENLYLFEIEEENLKHVVWDKLRVVRPKQLT